MATKRPKRMMSEQWYTVALLYPKYMTDWYGKDLYVEWAYAADVDEAVKIVQKKAEKSLHDNGTSGVDVDPKEFEPVLVFKGKQTAVADAANFG